MNIRTESEPTESELDELRIEFVSTEKFKAFESAGDEIRIEFERIVAAYEARQRAS